MEHIGLLALPEEKLPTPEPFYRVADIPRHPTTDALRFEDGPTIEDQRAALVESLSVEQCNKYRVAEVYDFLYRKHFGRAPSKPKDPHKRDLIFSRVFVVCVKEEIDLATYITANMHGMKAWLEKNRRMTFQPNMLSGPKALNRCRVYMEITNRRMRGNSEGFDSHTAHGDLRRELHLAEFEVGKQFVATSRHRQTSWLEATERVCERIDLPASWTGVNALMRNDDIDNDYVREYRACYGDRRLQTEFRLSVVSATAAVLRIYRADLADVVGSTRIPTWAETAALVSEMFPLRARTSSADLTHVPGRLAWRATA